MFRVVVAYQCHVLYSFLNIPISSSVIHLLLSEYRGYYIGIDLTKGFINSCFPTKIMKRNNVIFVTLKLYHKNPRGQDIKHGSSHLPAFNLTLFIVLFSLLMASFSPLLLLKTGHVQYPLNCGSFISKIGDQWRVNFQGNTLSSREEFQPQPHYGWIKRTKNFYDNCRFNLETPVRRCCCFFRLVRGNGFLRENLYFIKCVILTRYKRDPPRSKR